MIACFSSLFIIFGSFPFSPASRSSLISSKRFPIYASYTFYFFWELLITLPSESIRLSIYLLFVDVNFLTHLCKLKWLYLCWRISILAYMVSSHFSFASVIFLLTNLFSRLYSYLWLFDTLDRMQPAEFLWSSTLACFLCCLCFSLFRDLI